MIQLWLRVEAWLEDRPWYIQNPLSWLGHSLFVTAATLIGQYWVPLDLGFAVLGFYIIREANGVVHQKKSMDYYHCC